MIRHIVLWKLADISTKTQTVAKMKELLESFVDVVPGMLSAKVSEGYQGWDASLVSEHESREALDEYQKNPTHCEFKKFIHSVICERASCDFEV